MEESSLVPMQEIVELLPAADEAPLPEGAPADAPLLARVFKTVSEAHVGDVTYFRLYRGEVASADEVWNAEHDTVEKLVHASVPQGHDRLEVEKLSAGVPAERAT